MEFEIGARIGFFSFLGSVVRRFNAGLEGDIMPRRVRSESVDSLSPQFVHVWNRCVRRPFLCGRDRYNANSFEHRRVRARECNERLACCFVIDNS